MDLEFIKQIQPWVFAFLAGLLPALIWLFFWLKEDNLHPEPKKIILFSFLAGMIIVPIVLFFEKIVYDSVTNITISFILFATIEEIFKYIAAYTTGLSRKCDDEPIDNIIYLITVALGFAALENTLFLRDSIMNGDLTNALVTGSMRFVGSTLLHTVASATLGIFIAHAFYHSKKNKFILTILGLISAVVIHSIFNLIIIKEDGSGILFAFGFVWIMVVSLLLFFEKVKKIKGSSSLGSRNY